MLGIKQSGVDFLRCQVRLANHENLCTFVTGCLRLCGLHLLEKLLENPQERVVVLAAEYFGHEPSSRHQELAGELRARVSMMSLDCGRDMRLHESGAGGAHLEGVQREFRLVVGVLGPGTTTSYIRRTVVKYDFSLMMRKNRMVAAAGGGGGVGGGVPSAASSLA